MSILLSDLKVRLDIRSVFEGDRWEFDDSGYMRRRRFDDASAMEYETHTGEVMSEFVVILSNDPREFYYEFQFSETTTFPQALRLVGKGVER